MDDLVTTEDEIEKAVKKLRSNISRGALEMQAKHLKGWLSASKREKREASEKGEGKTDL